MEYAEVEGYVRAYAKDRGLAVVPVSMAAELFDMSSAGVLGRIKSGVLKEVRISGTRYVTMASILEVIEEDDREIKTVKTYLEQQARKGVSSVEYAPVMELLGLTTKLSAHRNKIGRILGRVSRLSYEEGKGMLSVIVHVKGTGLPSMNGFFGLVEALEEDWEDQYESQEDFVEAETKRVLAAHRK